VDASDVAATSDAAVRGIERVAVVYLVVAGVWILFSGALAALVADRTTVSLATLEIAKGLGFVLVTAAVLHQVLRRWSVRLRRAMAVEREAAERMRRAEDLRSAFLAGVSHELRTPLTAIVGYSQTIHRDAENMTSTLVEELSGRLVVNAAKVERILQHALDNAVKHSGRAASVVVSVTGDVDHVDIRVQDDGQGFPEPLPRGAA